MWAETGYGTQTKQVIPRLAADGHRVAVACNYGLQAMQTVYEGIPHYPMGVESYSNDVVEPTFMDWTRQNPGIPPLLIALFDAWPLKGPAWDRMPVGIWTMVDHLPVPPAVQAFLAKPNVTPLAASRFAQREIERAGIEALYVPMAIDTDFYKPTESWTREDGRTITGRQLMGFGDDGEDYFVVSCINANKSGANVHRKAWAENLLAFKLFAENHDDVRLYLHTERRGKYGGLDFDALLPAIGLEPHQYRFVNQWASHTGIPNEAMVALYTATDVLLAATYGEGFGLTTVEAASCGTVSILNDFTCQPEMQAEGWLTTGQPWWDGMQQAWWSIPNVASIVDALEAAYARGRGRSQAQRDHVIANFDADTVYAEHWRPALEAMIAEKHAAVEPLPTAWVRNDTVDPTLGIYIPAYKRDTLGRLLASLAPQLTDRVEVIISDDDPEGSGFEHVRKHLSDTPSRIEYGRRRMNLGPDANLLRGLEVGRAPWVWQMGDDDYALPGAVERILAAIDESVNVDRLVLLSEHFDSPAAGMIGSIRDIARRDPSLPIAATLITANVVRRDALDLRLAHEKLDTMYACSWANTTAQAVYVIPEPCIGVGTGHVDGYAGISDIGREGIAAIWSDLLRGYGIEPTPEAFARNYVNVAISA
jgi:glycosyltransferase involved in cell wall biosynthesis